LNWGGGRREPGKGGLVFWGTEKGHWRSSQEGGQGGNRGRKNHEDEGKRKKKRILGGREKKEKSDRTKKSWKL